MQQRAFIAKALAGQPSLLVLDEPTTGVDAESQESLAALLADLHGELGVTIVYVSHEFGAVEQLRRAARARPTDDRLRRLAARASRASGTTPRTSMLESEFMRLALGGGRDRGRARAGGRVLPRAAAPVARRRRHRARRLRRRRGGDPARRRAGADRARGRGRWVGSRSSSCARAAATAGDQALALVFYTGIALGVVLVAQAGALNVDLFQYLFGSILTVTRSDLALIAALGAVGLATIALLYRALAGVVIDEEGARVAGVPIGALNIALAALAAVTVALSMRVVGILLVAALMVLPVSAAGRIAWSMRSTLVALDGDRPRVGALRADDLVLRRPPAGRDDRARRGRGVRGRARRERRSRGYARRRRARAPTPGSWQPRQRASYCSAAPTTTVSPEYGAGSPSTSRCVVVAGPPQRWQTAWSLSTNSACERSSGIGPNGRRRKSWSSPATTTRTPRSARSSAHATTASPKNCSLVDPDDVESLRAARPPRRPTRSGRRACARPHGSRRRPRRSGRRSAA